MFIETEHSMQFQITEIEFDFDDDFGSCPEDEKIDVINETMTTIWEADDEEDLIEEITCASGWCIKSIDYVNVLN
jgi:hypothetical protein